ncbi:hypothetical protein [Actinacidiphila sp. ITFR-21]|uniref:hypothetical protein n=1 Tax=Actinacidiphila sp. ITFR-21 TaxID=3075199 RepID=UPI00288AD425|nr:hypothetical protein [Streptomyces sp. ITFR-21]WNI17566.1 hypothetical protein RLT57_19950 [Streptomyces sp. ITFR-21]WNI17706.1 hypothetical protein RLT57_20665 [Streptomyces sp. ITFR-21]
MTIEELLLAEMRAQVSRTPKTGRRAAWAFGSLADLLLEHGRLFTPASLPASVHRLSPRQCYANAFALATVRPELVYAEGYAVCDYDGDLIHYQHAWCVAEDGTVVDPTWLTPGDAYLGLPIGPRVGAPRFGPGLIHEMSQLAPVLEFGLSDDALVAVGRPAVSLSG